MSGPIFMGGDAQSALAQRALSLLPGLPVLRCSTLAPTGSVPLPPAEAIPNEERARISIDEIRVLTHYSPARGLPSIEDYGQCNWATALGVSTKAITRITSDANPRLYRALYLIKVHVPKWPGVCENIRSVSSGRGGLECLLAFTVPKALFSEVPVKLDPALDLLVPDP